MDSYREIIANSLLSFDLVKEKIQDDISMKIFNIYAENYFEGGTVFKEKFRSELLKQVESFTSVFTYDKSGKGTFLDRNENYVLYGAGEDAVRNLSILEKAGYSNIRIVDRCFEMRPKLVLDNTTYRIENPESVYGIENGRVLISSRKYCDEIWNLLIDGGLDKEKIIWGGYLIGEKDTQYFDCFQPQREESFLDVGGYTGDTALGFMKWCCNEYKTIDILEADPVNFELLKRNVGENRNVNIHFCAAYDKNGFSTITTYPDGVSSSLFSNSMRSKRKKIRVTTIDSLMEDKPCTFMKMDIEGAELSALHGAIQYIYRNKPKLAICIYHRYSDFINIPSFLLSVVPEYKFKIRQYSSEETETVLYASV